MAVPSDFLSQIFGDETEQGAVACPTISTPAEWYISQGLRQKFPICPECYQNNVRQTRYSVDFERICLPFDVSRGCVFSIPRIVQLWPQAVKNEDWSAIVGYLQCRATIPNCPGQGSTNAGNSSVRWFSAKDHDDIPGFVVCQACYEDFILATSFRDNFQPSPAAPSANSTLSCGLATPFFKSWFKDFSRLHSWSEFATAAKARVRMGQCSGPAGVPVSSVAAWYLPSVDIPGFVVCGACYLDYIALSPLAGEFSHYLPPPSSSGSELLGRCDMAYLYVKNAWFFTSHNRHLWWDIIRTIKGSPKCTEQGVTNGTWYTLAGQTCENFQICSCCYAGMICSVGLEASFTQTPSKQLNPGERQLCDFNPAAPRHRNYAFKLTESIANRSISPLLDYAVRFASLPLCPRSKAVKNRRWYGTRAVASDGKMNDFTICETCFEEVVNDTPSTLTSQLIYQKTLISEYHICDLYSPRMRQLWSEACTKHDLTDFLAFATYRHHVWAQTIPVIETIEFGMLMRNQQRNTLMLSSTFLHGLDGMMSANFPTTTTYGNAAVGYGYATTAGVQAQMDWQAATSINVGQGSEFLQISQLRARWREVE